MKKGKKITLFIFVTSLFVIMIYVINKILFFLSTVKEILFSDKSSFYNWRFGKVFYTKRGNGSPVLLIHDLDCTSSEFEWKEIQARLEPYHTVYSLDLLGCGRSDKPKMTYTNYLYVQLISDFIKNVIKHKTDVVVTGHAAPAVIMSCYMDKNLFQNMILVNPDNLSTIGKYPKTKHSFLKFIIDFPILGTFIYNTAVSKPFITESFQNKYFANSLSIPNRYINAYHEAAHLGGSSSKSMYSSIKCHYTNTNFIHGLKEINHSIYIIAGEQETNITETLNQYTELNPSIEWDIIKGTKHLPQLEKPAEFAGLLDIYLS